MAVYREFIVPAQRKLDSLEAKEKWLWNKRSHDFVLEDMVLEGRLLNRIRDLKRKNRLI